MGTETQLGFTFTSVDDLTGGDDTDDTLSGVAAVEGVYVIRDGEPPPVVLPPPPPPVETFSFVFIVDTSGSTGAPFGGTAVGDVNGDGQSDTILDAELDSLLQFQQAVIAQGATAQLSIVTFGSTSIIQDMDPVDRWYSVCDR